MTFDIPNAGDATFPDQEEVDSVDWRIITDAAGGRRGVSSGCAVTAQGSPDNTVAVAAGTIVYDGTEAAVTGGNLTMTAANATNPRFDLITVNNSGTKAYTAGTASANPVFPAIPANSIVIAAIFVPANDNVINTSQIKDRRITVSTPSAATGWITLSKATNQAKTTDTTLADDDTLHFTMAASTKYRIRGRVWITVASATPDFKYSLTGPASPTLAYITRRTTNNMSGTALTDQIPDLAYLVAATLSTTVIQPMLLEFEALVHNGANTTPDFALQWAQNTSDASAVTVLAGSYMEYKVA